MSTSGETSAQAQGAQSDALSAASGSPPLSGSSPPAGRRMSALLKAPLPPLQDMFRFWKDFSTANDAQVKKLMAQPDFVARVWSGIPEELRSRVWLKARTPDDRQIIYDETYANPAVVQEIEEELMFVRVPKDPDAPFLHPTLYSPNSTEHIPLVPLDDTRKELIRNVLKIDASVFQLTTMRPGAVQLILRLLPITKTVSNTVKVYQTLCLRMDSLWQNNHRKLYDMVLIVAEIIAELPALAEQFRRTDFSVHDLATLVKEWVLPVFACHFPVQFVLRAVDVALFDPRPQAFVALIYGMIKVAMPELLSLAPAPKRQTPAAGTNHTNAASTPGGCGNQLNSPTSPMIIPSDPGAQPPSGLLSPVVADPGTSNALGQASLSISGTAGAPGVATESVDQFQMQLQQTSPLLCLARIPLTTSNLTSAFAIGYDYVRSRLDEFMACLKQKDWNQAVSKPGLLKLEIGIGDAPMIPPSERPLTYKGYYTSAQDVKNLFDYQRELKNDANRLKPSPMVNHPLHGVADFFAPANDAETPLGGDLLSRIGTTLDVVDAKIRQRNNRLARKMQEEAEARKKMQEEERSRNEETKDPENNSNPSNGGGRANTPARSNSMTVSISSSSSDVSVFSQSSQRTMSSWSDRTQELLTHGDVNRLRALLKRLTSKLDEIEGLATNVGKTVAGTPLASQTRVEDEQKSLTSSGSVSAEPQQHLSLRPHLGHNRVDSSVSMVTSTMSGAGASLTPTVIPLAAPCLSMGTASLQYEANKSGRVPSAVSNAGLENATITQGIVRFSALSRLLTYPCVHMEGFLKRAKLSSADIVPSSDHHSNDPSSIKLVSRYYILQGPYLTQFTKKGDLFPSRDVSVDLRGRTITVVTNHPLGPYGMEILTHSGGTLYLLFANSEEERKRWISTFVSVSLLPLNTLPTSNDLVDGTNTSHSNAPSSTAAGAASK